ncbi:ABC transporter permease [Candidatus Saccharibacteria bacterium]|nr:ABC transporter permease [Candidatus Saccharibacteria bacterium]
MHNLSTVFRFEVIRSLKKKSFWISALSFPLIFAAIAAIIYFSNKTTEEAATQNNNDKFSLAVTDRSGLVQSAILRQLDAKVLRDKEEGIQAVTSGSLDAYFYYPQDLSRQPVEIYSRDVGLFDNGRYQGVSELILKQSVAGAINPQVKAILQNDVTYSATTYRDGDAYDGFKQLVAPGMFLVLFYILMALFGNQMLTSTTEEKENRVIEMLLTTVDARTLIVGKVLSLIVLALAQILIILIPVVAGYFLLGSQFNLPNFDITNIPLDAGRIAVGAAIFFASFMLYTGLLIAIGAATPTAKEANSFFGVVMTLLFAPLYAVTLFISAPESPLVRFLTLFPPTAPIPLMLRNAVGNLQPWETALGVALLVLAAAIALSVAVRLFRFGALEYSRRLSLKEIFARK